MRVEDAGIFSFPEGKRLAKFTLAADQLQATANPNYVIVKPLANVMLGVFDLKKGIVVNGMNKADATLWNDLMIYELVSGSVAVAQVKYDETNNFFTALRWEQLTFPSVR